MNKGGGAISALFGFGEEYYISTCGCFFFSFEGFLDCFLRYSCSISLRELKNAIKIPVFLYLGGLGTKIRFSSRKKNGAEYWYRRSGLGKNIGSVCRIYRGAVNGAPKAGPNPKPDPKAKAQMAIIFNGGYLLTCYKVCCSAWV